MSPNNTDPESASKKNKWSTGLCCCCAGCLSLDCRSCKSCWMTVFAPCITFGRIAEILDEGRTSCGSATMTSVALAQFGVVCFYTCSYRTKLRARYNLQKKPCADFCVHFCCFCCALCQEYRELQHQGLEPSKGWVFNASRMEGGATKPPSVAQGMTR